MSTERRLREHFAAAGTDLTGAWLFGSHARGTPHAESDVDVAVLFDWAALPDASRRGVAAERLSAELMSVLGLNRVDVVVLNDGPPLFARHIITQGISVFARDPQRVRAFERDVLLRAADVQPFVERARRRLLQELLS